MNSQEKFELDKKLSLTRMRSRLTRVKVEYYDALKEKDENLKLLKLKRLELERQTLERQIEEVRQEKLNLNN